MRPIHLRFSGLQSYKEAQEVDFQRLTELGVFGIFGPTGSGKSTILDAITLALYGRVERAGGTIQGIMNTNSDKLNVSFAFSLGGRLFRVERAYRRSRSGEISQTGARLIEESGDESRVLADRHVTAQVEELIGLDVNDFTRAVVLPQGKFAEFLTLTGRERRDMLERLFGLSAYGRQLTERVNRKFSETKILLDQTVLQQEALGDASEEALAAVKKQQEEAAALAEAAGRELQKASQIFEDARKQLALQRELAEVQRKIEAHKAREPELEKVSEELAASEKAEPLRYVLREWEAVSRQVSEDQKKVQEAEAKAAGMEEEAQKAQQAAADIAEKLSAEEPVYFRRLGELEEALVLEEEKAQLEEEIKDLREEEGSLSAKIANFQRDRTVFGQKKTDLEEELAGLERDLVQLTVSAQERERLNKASSSLQTLKHQEKTRQEAAAKHRVQLASLEDAEKSLAEARELVQKAEREYQALVAEAGEHAEKQPASPGELSSQGEELAQVRTIASSLGHLAGQRRELEAKREKEVRAEVQSRAQLEKLAGELAQRERKLAELKAAQAQAEEASLAARLALRLEEGKPCPVCGSSHHPAPQRAAEFEDHTQEIEKAERGLGELREQRVACEMQLKAAGESISEIDRQLAELAEKVSSEQQKLPEVWQAVEDLPGELKRREAAYEELKRQAAWWQEEQERLEAELAEKKDALAERKRGEAALAAKAEGARENLVRSEEELAGAEAQLAAAEKGFAELAGDMSPQELTNRVRELALWDRKREELEKKKQVINQDLKTIAEKAEAAAEELDAAKVKLAKLEAQLEEKEEKHKSLEEKLDRITSGQPARHLTEQLKESFKKLKEQQEASSKKAEALKEKLQEAKDEVLRAREGLSGTEKRLEDLEQELSLSLAKTGFPSRAAVASALRTQEERERLRKELEDFKQEGKLLSQEEKRLQEAIISPLSEEEYSKIEGLYNEAKAKSDEALSQLGAAQENYRQLQGKHHRWQELEEERKELAQKAERLESLQTVLRGNVFVDFLAEEQLEAIAQDATDRLMRLSGGHYALKIGEDCSFEIIDHFSGSISRTVNTLSGGETFLASLALALALSSHIQLRGKYPLEFFFLDEGFGTLDPELLETVITALEMLQQDQMTIGVISHVAELRQRLPRRLYVEPAEPLGRGSRIRLEVG